MSCSGIVMTLSGLQKWKLDTCRLFYAESILFTYVRASQSWNYIVLECWYVFEEKLRFYHWLAVRDIDRRKFWFSLLHFVCELDKILVLKEQWMRRKVDQQGARICVCTQRKQVESCKPSRVDRMSSNLRVRAWTQQTFNSKQSPSQQRYRYDGQWTLMEAMQIVL